MEEIDEICTYVLYRVIGIVGLWVDSRMYVHNGGGV